MTYNIMIIGSGQLALMLIESTYNLKEHINHIYIYSDKKKTPCHYLNFQKYNYVTIIIGNYNNKIKIKEIANKCDYITYEFEGFNTEPFDNETIKHKIYPSLDLLKIIQDKYQQKLFISKNISCVKVGDFDIINSFTDLTNFIKLFNFPVFLKSRKGAFDGRGNILINNKKDLEKFKDIKPNIYYVENFISFDKEVSIIGCKNDKKEFIYYNPVKNEHKNSILVKTIFPDINLDFNIKNQIIKILSEIINLFSTRGIICIELFIKNNKIFYNELCLRVHNSYHHSINSNFTSQFENHIRSLLNLNLGHSDYLWNGIFYNIISNLQELKDIKKEEDLKKKHYIKMYNKTPIKIRKIGHLVIKKIISYNII